MEPGHEDREDLTPCSHRISASCRNGARSTKTGKTRQSWPGRRRACCRNGARSRRPGRRDLQLQPGADLGAAMEPGHEDREDGRVGRQPQNSDRPQWSPVTKTGKTSRCSRCGAVSYGRNGARSRRPGRHEVVEDHSPVDDAAMEPGHEDREDRPRSPRFLIWVPPQWSPVTKTGEDMRRSFTSS